MRRPPAAPVLALVLLAPYAPPSSALDAAECRANHAAFLAALAANREQRLDVVRETLAEEPDEAQRRQIRYEGESAWDHEEQMRGLADQDLRDCLQHVQAGGGAAPGTVR